MKVIFLEHVINVAKKGEVKDVKPGYARNSLIPQGFAKKLTPELSKQMKAQTKREDQNRIALSSDKSDIIEKLEGKHFEFHLKWDDKKVFWSVTEKDILPVINKAAGVVLTKKYIILSAGHIKTFWEHVAHVKLGKYDVARIILDIKPE